MPSGIPPELPRPWRRSAVILGATGLAFGLALALPRLLSADGLAGDDPVVELLQSVCNLGLMGAGCGAVLLALAVVRRGAGPPRTVMPELPAAPPEVAGLVRMRPVQVLEDDAAGWNWHPNDEGEARRFAWLLVLAQIPAVVVAVLWIRPIGSLPMDALLGVALLCLLMSVLWWLLPKMAKSDAMQPRLHGEAGTLTLRRRADDPDPLSIPAAAVVAVRLRAARRGAALVVELVWHEGDQLRSQPLAATWAGCARQAAQAAALAGRLGVPLAA